MESPAMEFWSSKSLKSFFIPGGFILLGAVLLIDVASVSFSQAGVGFFYYAVVLAAALLGWRFHSKRILFSAIILLLGHHAIQFFAQGPVGPSGPGRIAFEAVGILIPLDFAFLTFFTERGDDGRALLWFIALLFFESVFVAAVARPDQPVPVFLHYPFWRGHHWRLPQPTILALSACLTLVFVRIVRFHRATDSGMFWSLACIWGGLQAGATGKAGTAYFGAAALALASSIIENSYTLAYHDELTGLNSRRSFNDALFRLRHPYAVAVVDIDHFKSINDTYGHDTGDQVLRLVASKLARVGGGGETFRVGGEEFTILFPNRNGAEVMDYLELLRLNIKNSSFRVRSGEERRKLPRAAERRTTSKRKTQPGIKSSTQISVTASMGVAESQPRTHIQQVIEQADKALYKAKHSGRNRIEMATNQTQSRQAKSKKSARV